MISQAPFNLNPTLPEKTEPVFLPKSIQTTLDQLTRQRDRLVDHIRRRKQRIQDLTIAINPTLMNAMGDFALTRAGRVFLRAYLDPKKAVKLGLKRLTSFLDRHYDQTLKPEKAEAIFAACKDAAAFYEPIQAQDLFLFSELNFGWVRP